MLWGFLVMFAIISAFPGLIGILIASCVGTFVYLCVVEYREEYGEEDPYIFEGNGEDY